MFLCWTIPIQHASRWNGRARFFARPHSRDNPISPRHVLYYKQQLQNSGFPTGMTQVWGYFILSEQVTSAGEESVRSSLERSSLHYRPLMSGIERQRIYSAFMVGWIFTAAQTNDNVSSGFNEADPDTLWLTT